MCQRKLPTMFIRCNLDSSYRPTTWKSKCDTLWFCIYTNTEVVLCWTFLSQLNEHQSYALSGFCRNFTWAHPSRLILTTFSDKFHVSRPKYNTHFCGFISHSYVGIKWKRKPFWNLASKQKWLSKSRKKYMLEASFVKQSIGRKKLLCIFFLLQFVYSSSSACSWFLSFPVFRWKFCWNQRNYDHDKTQTFVNKWELFSYFCCPFIAYVKQ
jgi:hypothetical protein